MTRNVVLSAAFAIAAVALLATPVRAGSVEQLSPGDAHEAASAARGAGPGDLLPLSEDEPIPPLPVLRERISLELRDADPRDVFKTFEAVLNGSSATRGAEPLLRIEVDDGIEGKLTICLQRVTVRTALRAACESLGCALSWQRQGNAWLLVVHPSPEATPNTSATMESLDEPIDLKLEGADLVAVLRTIGATSHRKVLIHHDLGGRTVSLSVERTPLRQVLDLLCREGGCIWDEGSDGVLEFRPR